MAAARQALAAVPGQVGAIVYIAGRWAGLDLLAGPGLFGRTCLGSAQAMWPTRLAGKASPSGGRAAAPS
jgi:hypothetical protein